MTVRRTATVAAAAALLSIAALAVPLAASAQDAKPRHTAEEIAKSKPVATFELTAEQVRLLVGGAEGRGTLRYKGKSYPFRMKGMTVGGVGVTKVNAQGDVYFMERVEDFAGSYSAATLGAALGEGAGASQYENNKGVFLKVRSKSEGVGLNLGLGAVTIEFAK